MKARSLVCIVSFAVAMAACNSQPADAERDRAAPTETVGTFDTEPVSPVGGTEQSEGTSGRAQQDRADLPDTASALPLAGLTGLLSLGVAIALRAARRS
jgi:hypothetical protein